MNKFLNPLNNMKAGRAKARAYADGGEVNMWGVTPEETFVGKLMAQRGKPLEEQLARPTTMDDPAMGFAGTTVGKIGKGVAGKILQKVGKSGLPIDEASRMARADKAYPQNVFHGTHDVFNEFDPSMVDIGVHVGTARQAENRLKSLSNPFSSGRSNTVRTGANIMPLKTNFGKSLEMEDVGNWKDSEVLSRALEKKGIKVDGLVDEASEVKSQYEDADNWLDSPENRRNLDDLNAALREKGYGSIKYKNLVENEYGELTQLLPAAEKQRALINSEVSHIQGKAYERMPKPPENPNSPTADAEMRVFLNSKMENYLQPHEAKRIDELIARSRTISDDPKSYDDPNSYIILDTAKLRSRFAEFNPAEAASSDIGKAHGGAVRKAFDGAVHQRALGAKLFGR